VAGYGIGLYTFRVLVWVVVLTVVGAAVLWYSPYARSRSVWWRLGASLHRLLPIVELNKEFKDFYENPPPAQANQPRNLNTFQVVFFSFIALAGWVLGFFLLAAMSGLTPKRMTARRWTSPPRTPNRIRVRRPATLRQSAASLVSSFADPMIR
jgi:hypothetical protein